VYSKIKVVGQMSEHVYDRLANIFMLVAVGSALLFNSASAWHWVVGAIGVVAGVAAVALYFTNQSRNPEGVVASGTAENVGDDGAVRQEPLTDRENWAVGLGADTQHYVPHVLRAYLAESAKGVWFYTPRNLVEHRGDVRLAYWHSYHEPVTRWMDQREDAPLSPDQIAACAVEIIRNLSSGEDRGRWEFNFGPRGLRVAPAKGAKASIEEQFTMGESEFDSEQVLSKIVN
jgi:hypothetical protein